jgi:hypothetical protein
MFGQKWPYRLLEVVGEVPPVDVPDKSGLNLETGPSAGEPISLGTKEGPAVTLDERQWFDVMSAAPEMLDAAHGNDGQIRSGHGGNLSDPRPRRVYEKLRLNLFTAGKTGALH